MNRRSCLFFLLCFLLLNGIYYVTENMEDNACVLEVNIDNESRPELYYSFGTENFSDEQMVMGEWSENGEIVKFLFPSKNIQLIRIDFSNDINNVQLKCIKFLSNPFWIKRVSAEQIVECIKETSNVSEISIVDSEIHFTTLGKDSYIVISDFDKVYSVEPRARGVVAEILIIIVSWLLIYIYRFFIYIRNRLREKVFQDYFHNLVNSLYIFIKRFCEKEERVYILSVTLIFAFIYLPIIINNNMYMYIDIGADTYCGEWPGIAYARSWLSDMKLYDMSVGIGEPTFLIITGSIFNPFHWCTLLFDEYNIPIGLYIGLILKNIVLSYYSYKYIKINNINGISRVVSSLVIVFSGWMVGWGQFYQFGTVYVFFIMALYGFKVWLKDSSFTVLIISLCMLAIASPYFCYMVLFFLATYYILYVMQRDKWRKENIKDTFLHGLKTLGVVLLSLGISAIILMPIIEDMLRSPRVNGDMAPSLALGSTKDYASMFFRMFSNNILGINNFIGVRNWYESPFLFVSILFLFSIIIFLLDRSNWKRYGKYIFITLFACIFMNFSSIIFNGFSTISYRWTFVFVPLFALALGNSFNKLGERKYKITSLSVAALFDIIFLEYGFWLRDNPPGESVVWTSLSWIFVLLNGYLICILFIKNAKLKQFTLLGILVIELSANGYYSVNRPGLLSNQFKETCPYFDDSNIAIDYLNKMDDSFYRISKKYASIDLNDNLIQHYAGERRYSAALSGALWDLISFFDLQVPQSNYFYGFDDKQALRNISMGKYRFTMSNENYFGYQKIAECGEVKIHKNMNSLTFGVLYDDYIVENEMDGLDSYERQDALYSTVVLEKHIKEDIPVLSSETVKGKLTHLGVVDTVVKEKDDTLKMDIERNSGPILIRLTGKEASGTIAIHTDTKEEVEENRLSFSQVNGEKTYYIDTLNINSIDIEKREGSIENVIIEKVDEKELTEKCSVLKNQTISIDFFSDTMIRATSRSDVDNILLLPILYDKNWNVIVNGEKQELYKADGGYTAIYLSRGNNKIEIKYISNSFYLGIIITLISTCILLVIIHYKKAGKGLKKTL